MFVYRYIQAPVVNGSGITQRCVSVDKRTAQLSAKVSHLAIEILYIGRRVWQIISFVFLSFEREIWLQHSNHWRHKHYYELSLNVRGNRGICRGGPQSLFVTTAGAFAESGCWASLFKFHVWNV